MTNALHPYLDHDGPIPFAHRGFSADYPENTMAAYEAAIRLGYRYLETDVHATRDGVLIAFHDDRLERVTDRAGAVAELTWDEVKRARVAGREPIPLLEDLLAAWPDARLNIDPKDESAVALLVAVLQRTRALARVCVGSFSGARLTRLRRALGPELCTSMGPLDVVRLRLASIGAPVGRFAANCVQVPPTRAALPIVDKAFLAAAHKRGLKVYVWTINEKAEMARLLDLGVDGIMSDKADVLKGVMQARGLWPG